MEMTFNPDPAPQAQEMIEMFRKHADNMVLKRSQAKDILVPCYDDDYCTKNARACALIAAHMCKAVSRPGDSIYPGFTGPSTTEYWSAVIEHLEKK